LDSAFEASSVLARLAVATALARTAVGALLLVTGIAKLRGGVTLFRDAILGYDLLPKAAASVLARWLPRAEIAIGLLLVSGTMLKQAETLAFVLICALLYAVVASLVRGRANHCGCLGFTAERVEQVQWHLAYRNLVLLGVLVVDAAWATPWGLGDWLMPTQIDWLPAASSACLLWAMTISIFSVAGAHIYSHVRHSRRARRMLGSF
jgi:hypothetical protein